MNIILLSQIPEIQYTLTPTGNGFGISSLILESNIPTQLTLEGNAKFYTDSGGTLNISNTWLLSSGVESTIYIRCESTSILRIQYGSLLKWVDWISDINSANIYGDITNLTSLTYLNISGNNTLYGSVDNLINLTHLSIS